MGLFCIGQTAPVGGLMAPVIDERVELLSIVARMAGFQEYNDSSLMPYVMSMAVHLSPPPAFAPVVAFGVSVPDRRWGREFGMRFAGLLRRFYRDAHCAEFFAAQRPLYDSALRRYMSIYNLLDYPKVLVPAARYSPDGRTLFFMWC